MQVGVSCFLLGTVLVCHI
jgi:hypothetical protein